MRIRSKIVVGFGILIIVLFALAGIGINRLNMTDQNLKDMYENRYQRLKLSTTLRNDSAELAKAIDNLILIDSEESDTKNNQIINDKSKLISQEMQQIDGLFTTPEERRLAEDMKQTGKRFMDYKDNVVQMNRTGKKQDANNLRTNAGNALQDQFIQSIAGISTYEEKAMDDAIERSLEDNNRGFNFTGILTIAGLLLGFGIIYWIGTAFNRGLNSLQQLMLAFAGGAWGDSAYRVKVTSGDEFGKLAGFFNRMADDLERTTAKERALNKMNEDNLWIQNHSAHLYYQLQETNRVDEMGQLFISELARMVGAQSGVFYVAETAGTERKLVLAGSYANSESEAQEELRFGQGLIGQAAKDGKAIVLDEAPSDYGGLGSALGRIEPLALNVQPILYDGRTIGVFELVFLKKPGEVERQMIEQIAEVFGIVLNSLKDRLKNEELLRIHKALTDELQSQSEELLSQQDELKASNEHLEVQARALKASEELLQRQQEELEQANEALTRKTVELEEQVKATEEINRQIESAKESLEKQTFELALASRYKSEFLANMSHELRTPLNSLLILSQLLKENKEGNLTVKQVEYAETIYSSGCDLLKLIDDVLDLAKVESGRMDVQREQVDVPDLIESLQRTFAPVARSRNLDFKVRVHDSAPNRLITDASRLLQILKNLLSNAFKFTHSGWILLDIGMVNEPQPMISFAVEDTGIGIPSDKQELVFEAFRQADGTTSRKYGGTGLGLSISRQLAGLLGGKIGLQSEEGKGSRFTVYLPLIIERKQEEERPEPGALPQIRVAALNARAGRKETAAGTVPSGPQAAGTLPDDRDRIGPDDKVLLIIEDDQHFAGVLLDMARSRGFKAIVALSGDTGLELAKMRQPDAILLDIQLPVIDGWSVLVQLKNDNATRHIPVHVISVVDEVHRGLALGAIAWLRKPSNREGLKQAFDQIQSFLDRELKNLLLVEPDESQRANLTKLIARDDLSITAVKSGEYAESILIKDVKSPERLLDETSLFLHRVEESLPEEKKQVLQKLHSIEAVFTGKKVLLADDDIRNVFALSTLLEGLGMEVAFAETGRQALELLHREPDFDLVLMDIMMPEVDGFEAMRAIREDERFDRLPIIALTAKAMKEDREKCIAAGASDYITKPVHTDQLLSLMRVWLCK
ncbi:response regulator [Paenibacillus filicis]|uniref:histidine kinase n=1 Tax=Paenibacillus gyeongsangnamensis TaxID=3388067 RepID=A0ABT4QH35_9BACL|nr:response regulator [Paenibacillus filicis]MCZ8516207.1 response regulator [Paenibacillus filicis]